MSVGRPQVADAFYKHAQQMLPQLKEQRVLTHNGQRVVVNLYNDGSHEILPDVGPDQEKAHFLDMGNSIVPVDPITGKPLSNPSVYNKSMTPGEQASNSLGYARLHQEKAQANKPQIVTDNNGNFFAVDPRSAQGTQVTDTTGAPLNKGDKPLTEVQGNATAFGMRMAASNKIINDLEDSGFDTGKLSNLAANNRATNYAASPEAQKLYQAKLNFMSASLRKESGAAISQSEYDAEDKKYFPQPGDSNAVKQQKRQMRDLALEAMAKQAGPGGKTFGGRSASGSIRDRADAILQGR